VSAGGLNIEVVYPLPTRQEVLKLAVPAGTTVAEGIELSGILAKYPDIDLKKNKVGIYAKLAKLDAPLRDFDRIEIYRPLIADPKEVRKRRAAEGKVMKKGVGDADVPE
jgi:putative ubiquitin-RnfH superfamily antitoxin RatB of RatAB toxin-antitoxin module